MKVTKQPKQEVTNPQNKTDKFSGVASGGLKSHVIETHRKSGRHKSALEAEMPVQECQSSWRKKKLKYQS